MSGRSKVAPAIYRRPECPQGHGPMELRTVLSAEAAWCGVWFDCARCVSSALFPSEELAAMYREGAAR